MPLFLHRLVADSYVAQPDALADVAVTRSASDTRATEEPTVTLRYSIATSDSYGRVSHVSKQDRSVFYGSSIVTAAAQLLDQWRDSAERDTPDLAPDADWVDQLADIALRVTCQPYYQHNRRFTDAEMIGQLDEVAATLINRGVDANRSGRQVALPRTARTPEWDGTPKHRLAVAFDHFLGGKLEIELRGTPAIRVITTSIGDLVRAAIDVNSGLYGNPFAPR